MILLQSMVNREKMLLRVPAPITVTGRAYHKSHWKSNPWTQRFRTGHIWNIWAGCGWLKGGYPGP